MATEQEEAMRDDAWQLIRLAHAAIHGDPKADVQALADRTLPKYGDNPAGLVALVAGMGAVLAESLRLASDISIDQVFAAVEQAELP